MFFSLTTWELGLLVFTVIVGASAAGVLAGRYLRRREETHREPIGVLQGTLLGIVGLILAFGLSLAVGRYQDRRADVVADANTIGTAYLRAQTLPEPQRSRSLALLRSYNDLAIQITYEVPGSTSIGVTSDRQGRLQRSLWRLAAQTLEARPNAKRATVVRRQPERDDRPARRPAFRPQQSRAQTRCSGSSCSAPRSRSA